MSGCGGTPSSLRVRRDAADEGTETTTLTDEEIINRALVQHNISREEYGKFVNSMNDPENTDLFFSSTNFQNFLRQIAVIFNRLFGIGGNQPTATTAAAATTAATTVATTTAIP